MDELAPGLRTWSGAHPEWRDAPVRSYAVEVGGRVVLIDPIAPAPAGDAVLLTCPWHRRSTDELGLEVLDTPPEGIEAHPSFFAEEVALLLREHRALVLGDALMNGKVAPPDWAPGDLGARARVRALLDLDFDLVLPTHGAVSDRTTFARALDA
jgi:hypothetical protein